MFAKILGVGGVLVGLSSSTSLAQEITRDNSHEAFVEVKSENSQVSGDVILGAMLIGDDVFPQVPNVVTPPGAWLARNEPAKACVRIVAKDGRYIAENAYTIPAGFAGERADFTYDGELPDFLQNRKSVIRVTSGECTAQNPTLVPASWADAGATTATTLNLFVNAAGNFTAVAVGDGTRFFEPCRDVTEATGLKYTTICEIPVEVLAEAADPIELTFLISRNNTEERFAATVMQVFRK
ncbi:hypothetical protein [Maritimibacter sp. DP1N21-5]|uniref:hypothetical protein n=1 Tax=Maritimibacter sp. DP1N21-5 TaxID=2836867 RepID=UPI001C459786|nr:hypothetical protein [Maritimibacter sp. DP1N21-5]MBV7408567.1 hypothetical protein [Maritimibacter sp. DP1N21-5]